MEQNPFAKYKTFVMLGKPGSGKGMQSKMLSEKSGFKVFSSGDKFRELTKSGTFLGNKIASVIDHGNLMPYWFASFLFQEAVIYLPQNEGVIFEGAGRKVAEAELFHDVMTWLERPYLVVYLDISHEEVTKRLIKRKEIEGRADDTEEKIKVRLQNFENETQHTAEVFKKYGTLLTVNGDQTPEEVAKEILQKVSERS